MEEQVVEQKFLMVIVLTTLLVAEMAQLARATSEPLVKSKQLIEFSFLMISLLNVTSIT